MISPGVSVFTSKSAYLDDKYYPLGISPWHLKCSLLLMKGKWDISFRFAALIFRKMKPTYLLLCDTVAKKEATCKWTLKFGICIFWDIFSTSKLFRSSWKLIVTQRTPFCPSYNFIDCSFAHACYFLQFFGCTIWSCVHQDNFSLNTLASSVLKN